MVLPAISFALFTSSLLYLMTPRMPSYQITSIRLATVNLSYLLRLDCQLFAGIQVENTNFFGADIHAALVDIYYPDWDGTLNHIGVLREVQKKAEVKLCYATATDRNPTGVILRGRDTSDSVSNESSMCLADDIDTKKSAPFLTIQPRSITISDADIVSIILKNVGPYTYFNAIKDAIKTGGTIDILISGVAHVKSSLGLPLSLGIICDNTLDLFGRPTVQIAGRRCTVRNVWTGWTSLADHAKLLQQDTMRRYTEEGRSSLFKEDDNGSNEEAAKGSSSVYHMSTDRETHWHYF